MLAAGVNYGDHPRVTVVAADQQVVGEGVLPCDRCGHVASLVQIAGGSWRACAQTVGSNSMHVQIHDPDNAQLFSTSLRDVRAPEHRCCACAGRRRRCSGATLYGPVGAALHLNGDSDARAGTRIQPSTTDSPPSALLGHGLAWCTFGVEHSVDRIQSFVRRPR